MPKSTELISLFEYDRINNDQLMGELTSMYLKDEKWSKFLNVQKAYFKHYVGIVQTGSYRVSILPKIWKENGQNQADAIKNLLRMLLYTYQNTSFFNPETVISPKYESNDLFELLILFYAITLETQMNQGMYRRYVRMDDESKYLRGKLNLARHLNRIDKSSFDITDFRFSADNRMNRYFAYATTLFSSFTQEKRSLDLLTAIELLFQSEGIPNHVLPGLVGFNRLNDRFQIPYNYADLIIKHMSPEPGNERRAMMMLFDMNIVFQEFFVKFIKRNKSTIFSESYVNIESQYSKKNFIFKEASALRFTTPDLYIEVLGNGTTERFIIDMKYKIMKYTGIEEMEEGSDDDVFRITPSDLYQMFVYSDLHSADHTLLLFPGSENKISGPYKFKRDGPLLWICMLNLDLKENEWEKDLVKEFREIFNKIKVSNPRKII